MYKKYYDYLVYEDGNIYSLKRNKFLKGEITKHGYLQYTLRINNKAFRIKSHRLVATLFIREPVEGEIVNHIDANKLNNHYSNLEWCSYYHNNKHARDNGTNNISNSNSKRWNNDEFRSNVSKKISNALIQSGRMRGKTNPNFRYLILKDGIEISREELSIIINRCLSSTDIWIRKCSNGQKVNLFIENNITIVDTKKS